MTTLPTTTPMRLPRPVPQQTPLALGGPVAAQPGGGFQMTGADVWRVIRSNLWLIVAMLIISGIGGYGIFRFLDAKFRKERTTFSDGTTVTVDWDASAVDIQPLLPGGAGGQ